MTSPFPGMDPYLADPAIWPGFHLSMLAAMKAFLNAILPEHYSADAEHYIWLVEPDGSQPSRRWKPDGCAFEQSSPTQDNTGEALLVAPAISMMPAVEPKKHRFVTITDHRSHRIVTVVQLLSPSNKAKKDERNYYLAKRNNYFATGTNLIEIDLLRSGGRLPLGNPTPPIAPYFVVVWRAVEYPRTAIWPVTIRQPLPDTPIPLGEEDVPVWLSLQKCLDRAYDDSAYRKTANYQVPPVPPLDEPDATWAAELIRERLR